MGELTGTRHGDAANELLGFYQDRALELEQSGQYFMAAIALALALETAVLTYLLVEFGEENGGELQIPDNVSMSELRGRQSLTMSQQRWVRRQGLNSRGSSVNGVVSTILMEAESACR